MFGFGSGKKKQYDIVLDIGSGSVGTAIVEYDPGVELPKVRFSHRERMRLSETFDPARHLQAFRTALLSATATLSTQGLQPLAREGARIGGIRALVSAPWAETVSRTVSYRHDKPFGATGVLIEQLLDESDKEIEHPREEVRAYKDFGLRVAHRSLGDVRLNGYRVEKISGQRATELSVAVIEEFVSTVVSETIDDVEKNLTPHHNADERTHAFVLHRVLRRLSDESDALIVDVTGEATECTIVEDGVFAGAFSMARGAFTLERDLAQKAGTIPAETKAYVEDPAHGGESSAHTEVMASYVAHFTDFFRDIGERYVLPKAVFLVADMRSGATFRDIIGQALGTENEYRFTILDENAITRLAHFTEGSRPDPLLAAAASFFHTKQAGGD